MLETTIDDLVTSACPSEYPEEWALEELLVEVAQYYPTEFTVEDLAEATTRTQISESLLAEALDAYHARDQAFPGGEEEARQVEREVMLQIIDQRWQEHLAEMDYLREGINLRAMGQQDPLVAWQREGFSMFEQLIGSIDADYLRYVMHVQVIADQAELDLTRASYQAAADPSEGPSLLDALRDGAPGGRQPERRGASRRREPCRPPGDPAAGQVARSGAAQRSDPDAQAPLVRAPRRSSAETSRAGAGAARSTSSVMAPAEDSGASRGETRDQRLELVALRGRLEEAEVYLGLEALRARRIELEKEVSRPDLWDDADNARLVTTEFGRVGDDIAVLDDLDARLSDAETLHQMMVEEDDTSVSGEVDGAIDDLVTRLDELELRSLFTGDYVEGDAICELHAGAGGTDAQDWCEMLLRMYQRWAERRGFTVELDEATEGQEAGLLSATFIVRGRFAYGLLSAERGVHRLVRMSPFDAAHRRQTSFASLDVTPFLEDVGDEVDIDEKDLRVDTYRSSGAGGQHVNKTDSAVRITHLPTNIVVAVQNERSQHQNRAKAMQILAAKLVTRQRAERRAELDSLSGPQSEVAWGNQSRSYFLHPNQLVKDHRTNFETGNIEAVLDGDIDALIEAELRRRRAEG